MPDMSSSRRVAAIFWKVVLPIVVTIAVGWYFWNILSRPELWERDFSFRVEWLLPAALLYLVAHSLWGAFWTTLLRNQGMNVSLPLGLRGYFVSQLGKYVPGKVWVIVIRVAMLGKTGGDKAIVGVTAVFETLTTMAAGAFLGVMMLPLLAAEAGFKGKEYWLLPVALVPVGLWLLNRLIYRITKMRRGPDAKTLPIVGITMILRGLVQTSIGWLLLGLSLWMTIQGLQPNTVPLSGETILRLVAVNCLAYVFGFLAIFMPGGAGVREWLLAQLLVFEFTASAGPEAAAGIAIVIALVLRLIWTVAELSLAFILYKKVPSQAKAEPIPVFEVPV